MVLNDTTEEMSYHDVELRAMSESAHFHTIFPLPALNTPRALPVPPFNPQPVLVMWDEDIRVDIKCLHCSILFHWTSHAIQHWSSERHLQMVEFLNGEPMMYCVVCNWLPDMPHQHLQGQRHMKALRKLGRIAHHADMQIRRVLLFDDGRKYAVLVAPFE